MSEVVRTEVARGVAVVSLNRPDKLNAMNPEMFEGLAEAGRRVESDEAVRAVLLRGEGRAFSSGLDLASIGGFAQSGAGGDGSEGDRRGGPARSERQIPRAQESFKVWARMPKPVVAAVHGYAFGAGIQLALAADLRVAEPDCQWAVFEITYGLVPDLGGTHRLTELVGPARAKELIWLARRFTSTEAEGWGLANRVVPADRLEAEARDLAGDLAGRPPLPIAYTKELVDAAHTRSLEEGMRAEAFAQALCLASEDMREAIGAAFERREPRYSGT